MRFMRRKTLLIWGMVALMAVGLLGLPQAGAEVRGNVERSDGAWGWHAPGNPNVGVDYLPECVDTSIYGPRLRVRVRTVMWARGDRIDGFHFKVRLVPAGSDGRPVGRAWSDNVTRSFATTSTTVRRLMTAWTPSEDPAADWEIEVKLKYSRSGGRLDYRRKFRVPITQPDCLGGGYAPS